MININSKIDNLNLSPSLTKKLNSLGIQLIEDLFILKRKELKAKGLNDKEIKSIIISLQLEGLDLNKKIYD